MEWTDRGFVLSARRHGESAVIVQLLTEAHGRHAGLVRGGAGTRARGVYQPGNLVSARWRARLAEHLGSLACELDAGHAARFLDQPGRLAALSAAASLVEAALPERLAYPAIFAGFAALIDALGGDGWAAETVRFELALLAALGYGLDLGACAATGAREGLAFVSPKSGRAVSAAAGAPYRDRLLSLPAFLLGDALAADAAAIAAGFALTGYFLEQHVFAPQGGRLPAARRRLAAQFAPR
jgi:DNA repair protein RecO (recombination protein O)